MVPADNARLTTTSPALAPAAVSLVLEIPITTSKVPPPQPHVLPQMPSVVAVQMELPAGKRTILITVNVSLVTTADIVILWSTTAARCRATTTVSARPASLASPVAVELEPQDHDVRLS